MRSAHDCFLQARSEQVLEELGKRKEKRKSAAKSNINHFEDFLAEGQLGATNTEDQFILEMQKTEDPRRDRNENKSETDYK